MVENTPVRAAGSPDHRDVNAENRFEIFKHMDGLLHAVLARGPPAVIRASIAIFLAIVRRS